MNNYFQKTTSAAPLVVFRIALGLLIFGSIARFWAKGWIFDLYIKPKYFFPFYGFEFVEPLGELSYLLFAICGLCALMVAIGLFYRIASAGLFLSFTYIELIDKSTYLNHYYFISMVCLMMLFLPAHRYFSIDAYRNKKILSDAIPRWSLDSLKFFVCLVYVFAGLAKLNSDWILHAQPLRIWLPAKNDLPVIGFLFNYVWVAYAFSWIGCVYDLSIPFLLLKRKTRIFAYSAVVIFHMLTALLFPIGMFPYIMMVTALIFFSPEFHEKILLKIGTWIKVSGDFTKPSIQYPVSGSGILPVAFGFFLLIQVLLPLRHVLYPDELFWTEQGYRFSWRVMLIEKAGYAQFIVKDAAGNQAVVDNSKFLTPLQEKMMATQPDMILQYAHILRDHYNTQGFRSPQVYVDSYVALNGRLGKPLVDPITDLSKEKDSFSHKPWILPFGNEIKGI
ncbi:MAG: HTTM domain-containing protein [Cyclobacteriaceae bacterium]